MSPDKKWINIVTSTYTHLTKKKQNFGFFTFRTVVPNHSNGQSAVGKEPCDEKFSDKLLAEKMPCKSSETA